MKRVHRTTWERFNYLAIYECRQCRRQRFIPHRFRMHLGADCRCPKCGTQRLKKLLRRDHVDPMWGGFLNLLERLAGGSVYHCRYCRIQFYDRRRLIPPEGSELQSGSEIIAPPNTASSDA